MERKIYFEKTELNKWLLKNRAKPESELEQMANEYIAIGKEPE